MVKSLQLYLKCIKKLNKTYYQHKLKAVKMVPVGFLLQIFSFGLLLLIHKHVSSILMWLVRVEVILPTV